MPTDTAPVPTETLSEADYLDQQAQAAKDAIAKTLGEIKNDLASVVDPHRLTHDHPFVALGAAAVAGFAAAAVLVPSKEQQSLRKLAALHRSLNAKVEQAGDKASKDKKDGGSPWWSLIVAELFKVLRPMLVGLITSNLGGGPDSDATPADDASESAAQAPGDEAPAVASPS